MTYNTQHAEEHINACIAASKKSPSHLFRAIFLAVGSIRIRSRFFWCDILPFAYQTFNEHGLEIASKRHKNFAAMTFKAKAIKYCFENREKIYHAYNDLSSEDFFAWLIENVPGLGFTKAAFVVQMTYGVLGCLDSVNIQRFGLGRIRTTKEYLEALELCGESCVELWCNWCKTVAKRDNLNTFGLSLAHYEFIENGTYNPELLKMHNVEIITHRSKIHGEGGLEIFLVTENEKIYVRGTLSGTCINKVRFKRKYWEIVYRGLKITKKEIDFHNQHINDIRMIAYQ